MLPAVSIGQNKNEISITDFESLHFMPSISIAQNYLAKKNFKLKEITKKDNDYIFEQKTKIGFNTIILAKPSDSSYFSDVLLKITDSLTIRHFDKSILLIGYKSLTPINYLISQSLWYEKTIQVVGTKLIFSISVAELENYLETTYRLRVEAK